MTSGQWTVDSGSRDDARLSLDNKLTTDTQCQYIDCMTRG